MEHDELYFDRPFTCVENGNSYYTLYQAMGWYLHNYS